MAADTTLHRNEAREPESEVIPPSPSKRAKGEQLGAMPGPDIRKLADAKSTPKPGRRSKAEYVADMAKQLFGVHQLAAMLTGFESAMISEAQAAELAEPVYDVCVKWGLPINGITSPEFKLLCAAGAIYGPMALAVRFEILRKQSDQAPPADANVVYPTQFRPPPVATPPQAAPEGMTKPPEGGAVDLSLVGQPAAELQAGE